MWERPTMEGMEIIAGKREREREKKRERERERERERMLKVLPLKPYLLIAIFLEGLITCIPAVTTNNFLYIFLLLFIIIIIIIIITYTDRTTLTNSPFLILILDFYISFGSNIYSFFLQFILHIYYTSYLSAYT